ncbi:MAG: DUF3786 domain-containing protein [Desulfobacterales bacterium]|jgi:hypothetical protein|nr:DUF3786 domain-containing protein [Desulfobacterales bacterium]
MAKLRTAVDILKLLNKSNCQECGEKTCLAFAAAVIQGRRKLSECPHLEPEVLARYADDNDSTPNNGDVEDRLAELKSHIADIDLSAAAQRTGGEFKNGRLTVKILGKNFSVDADGKLYADIHVNHWVAVPFLNYVISGEGRTPTGNWMPFRELPGGRERAPLFEKRCEEPMKQLADRLPDFFDDIVHMFSGSQVDPLFESDISVVLDPLPKVPLMICYWKPEEGMDSSLSLFFDETAATNLDIGATYTLGAGLSQMFSKLALRHGFAETATV